jgi:hypothetical protein
MLVVFGNGLDIEGIKKTFDIAHLLDSSLGKLNTLF